MAAINTKFFFLLITGAPAAGKFTVGKILEKKLKVPLFHNHLVIDLVKSFIKGDKIKNRSILRQKVFFECLDTAGKEQASLVITHTYGHDYVANSGMSDRTYVSKIKKIVEKYGGVFYSVHLIAERQTLYKRVTEPSRKMFGKIKTIKVLKDVLDPDDTRQEPFKDSLVIDSTNMSAQQVTKRILTTFKI